MTDTDKHLFEEFDENNNLITSFYFTPSLIGILQVGRRKWAKLVKKDTTNLFEYITGTPMTPQEEADFVKAFEDKRAKGKA